MFKLFLYCIFFITPLLTKEAFHSPFGLYINHIYNIDINKKTFDVIASIWWKTPELNPTMTKLKVINALDSTMYSTNFTNSKKDKCGIVYSVLKARACADFNSKNYPFDQHKLFLIFESDSYSAKELIFKDSGSASFMLKDLVINGWNIIDTCFKEEEHVYPTNFGNENVNVNVNESKYSRLTYEIKIKRDNCWSIFLREHSGFYLGFVMLMIAFFVPPKNNESKISLALAALFIIFTTHRFLSSALNSYSFSLTDAISLSSYLAAIISIMIFVLALFIRDINKIKLYNHVSFLIINFVYISYNIFVVFKSACYE